MVVVGNFFLGFSFLTKSGSGLKSVFPNVPGEEHDSGALLKSPICRFRSHLHKILLEMGGGGFCEFNNNPELLLNKFHPRYSLD